MRLTWLQDLFAAKETRATYLTYVVTKLSDIYACSKKNEIIDQTTLNAHELFQYSKVHIMSKVLVLYTGGTIGMIKDPESGHLGSVDFTSVYEHIPELNQAAN